VLLVLLSKKKNGAACLISGVFIGIDEELWLENDYALTQLIYFSFSSVSF